MIYHGAVARSIDHVYIVLNAYIDLSPLEHFCANHAFLRGLNGLYQPCGCELSVIQVPTRF